MTRRVLVAAALGCATFVFAQSEDKEGKAWLEANRKAPPEINVTGLWHADDWGKIPLTQKEGARTVIGTGDAWDISGVVSGKEVYLLFSNRGKVKFSARLTADSPQELTGNYAAGILASNSKTRPMHLSR